MSAGPRILVTPRSLTERGLTAAGDLEPLRAKGYDLVAGPAGRLPTEEQLIELLPGCAGWLAGVERITDRVLGAAPGLRVISRNGAGTDGIDLAAARRRGVRVERAAGANAQGVAELTLALTLSALRHVPWSAAGVARGRWERTLGAELADCTIGVVGLGAVGSRVARLFTALGARVLATDPVSTGPGVRMTGLEELLAAADAVTLHCPPLDGGRPLVDDDRLALLRRGAVLVNTARSALVDDHAVLTALRDGTLSAYAVDAFDAEPPELTPLLRHERVIATPHLGGYTAASVRRATSQAVVNLLAALEQA
ncbi:NAD(P)-dependent oxidoreductase [Dactylosporangium sp. CA-092794]|uniref:NAD(P)-dependent oxidoreductase n=1 Tax=Dactylosporangium sp. CA-092794 TaxID=3239929 RepID=UPI003D8ED8AB